MEISELMTNKRILELEVCLKQGSNNNALKSRMVKFHSNLFKVGIDLPVRGGCPRLLPGVLGLLPCRKHHQLPQSTPCWKDFPQLLLPPHPPPPQALPYPGLLLHHHPHPPPHLKLIISFTQFILFVCELKHNYEQLFNCFPSNF